MWHVDNRLWDERGTCSQKSDPIQLVVRVGNTTMQTWKEYQALD